MKKHILPIASILAVLACFAGIAAAGISGSQHDLTVYGYGNFIGENDEVCVYCHTPHNAISQDPRDGTRLPLWNRTLNTDKVFTMYTSGSLQAVMPADNKPTGYSLLCLSCHDGLTSLGAVINNSQSMVGDIPVSPVDKFSLLPMPDSVNVNIGRDLSNDHPVSFVYDNTLVSNDQTANGGVIGLSNPASIAPLKLAPGSRLECTTCHDAHSNANAPFLRMSNTGSAMCRKCHLK